MRRMVEHIMMYMAAVAYAEAGEFDTARSMIQENKPRKNKYEMQKKRRAARLTASRSA